MKCSELMTKNPSCCLVTDNVYQAAQLMKTEDVGPVPIVSDQETKKLEGIVTDRDLALKVVAELLDPKRTQVRDVMTTGVLTCYADDEVERALDLMEQHQVRRIPILDEKDRLVGIISQADVATRFEEPEKTAEVVEEISKGVGA